MRLHINGHEPRRADRINRFYSHLSTFLQPFYTFEVSHYDPKNNEIFETLQSLNEIKK